MNILQMLNLIIAASLNGQFNSERLNGRTDIIQIPQLEFIVMKPAHNIIMLHFTLLQDKGTAAGADFYQTFCLKQTNCFPDGSAPHIELCT